MAKSRQETGCQGIMLIGLGGLYWGAYALWGVEGYIHLAIGASLVTGVFLVAIAAISD